MSTTQNQALLSKHALGEAGEWVHLRADAPDASALLESMSLVPWAVDALTELETRPRALAHADGVLLVLRGVNANPGADPDDMISLRIWITPTLVVTARRRDRKLLSVQDIQHNLEQGNGPTTVSELIAQLVERIAERIGDFVDSIDENLTRLETASEDSVSPTEARKELTELRQQTAAVRRYLAPQRDALEALFRARGPLSETDSYSIRDQADRTVRYVEDLDLARERALVLQELWQQRIAEQQNARMYVLAIVSAIFLPLSFLTGVFGMNVGGLPGTENVNGFWLLCGGLVVITAGILLYMRRQRWL